MGGATVEPAPLIEPAAPPPPPVSDFLLLEPHAARPAASRKAAPSASQVRDLKSFSFVVFVTPPRLPSPGRKSVTDVWRLCEKAVKVLYGSGSRTRSGCG